MHSKDIAYDHIVMHVDLVHAHKGFHIIMNI